MKTFEKQPPRKQITDEQRSRRVTYYHSDIDPYPLIAAVDLRYSDGSSSVVHVEVTDDVVIGKDRDVVLAANEKVWLAAVAQDEAVEKA